MSDAAPDHFKAPHARAGWAILSLAVGSFGIGTGEFASMGLLPEFASSLHVSAPEAGHVISAYALGVVVGAPSIALLFARAPRRTMLVVLMLVFGLANGLSALAPNYGALLALRFLSGLPHGAFFGIAALVAASLVEPGFRARAVGRVFTGLTLATLLGMPFSAWIGQWFGWRPAFAGVGAIGFLAFAMVLRFVPFVAAEEGASPLRELSALARPQVWLTLGIAAVGCGGMFAVISYIVPLLTEVSGIPPLFVPLALVLFGLGMFLGNFAGSAMADRALMPTVGGMLLFNAVALGLLPLMARSPGGACLSLFLVGFSAAIVAGLQTRLMDVAAGGQTLAATLMHSAFNLANALGAFLGGAAIAAGYGWSSTGVVGAILAAGGLVIFGISVALDRRTAGKWKPLPVPAE